MEVEPEDWMCEEGEVTGDGKMVGGCVGEGGTKGGEPMDWGVWLEKEESKFGEELKWEEEVGEEVIWKGKNDSWKMTSLERKTVPESISRSL